MRCFSQNTGPNVRIAQQKSTHLMVRIGNC